jgi:medium-chain acyl-[acyl-carrier-protein] hydrolase
MYSYDARIRYSECGSDRKLTIPALINLFQNCSSFHSEDAGVGIDYVMEHDGAWFILNWQIDIDEMPSFCDKVKVCTVPYEFKGFFGNRNFWLEDEHGNILVKAATLWSYMNIKTLRPMKPDEKQLEHYELGQKLDMEYLPRKLALVEGLKEGEAIPVRADMIDTNNHVNNGQYINIAMALMAQDEPELAGKPIRRVLAEYKKSAVMGDTFHPYTGYADGRYYVCLKDDNGNINVIVVFEI